MRVYSAGVLADTGRGCWCGGAPISVFPITVLGAWCGADFGMPDGGAGCWVLVCAAAFRIPVGGAGRWVLRVIPGNSRKFHVLRDIWGIPGHS